MSTISRLTLTVLLLTAPLAIAGKSAGKAVVDDDPCSLDSKVSSREFITGFTKLLVYINQLETSGVRSEALQALDYRRKMQLVTPHCYEWCQRNLGLGRSPITGE